MEHVRRGVDQHVVAGGERLRRIPVDVGAGHGEPERFTGRERGRERPYLDINGNGLSGWKRKIAPVRGDRLRWRGALRIELAPTGSQPPLRQRPVVEISEEREPNARASGVELIQTDKEIHVLGAWGFHPETQGGV